MPAPGDVWITDNLQATQNLVGGVDEDVDSERALAVRWYLDDRDCQSYHVYVSVDGAPYKYLCHTVDKTENKLEWKAGRRAYLNPAFIGGPQYGHAYAFQVYTVTASGKPFSLGPYATKGAVTLVAPSVEAQNVELIRQFLDKFMNKKNLSFADQVMSPDFVDEDTGMGLEAFKMAWGGILNAIPDAYVISEDLFASGDKVVNRATVGGTHLGDLVLGDMNIPATGKPYAMTSICIFQVQDGKITRHWSQMDMLGMLEQLGVMPPSREFFGWTVPSPITGDPGDPDANLALALREFEGLNQSDKSYVDEIYSPEVIVHNPNRPDITNFESYKNWLSEFISWDQSTTINLSFAAGDKVVLNWLWEGVMPDIGRKLVQPGISIYRIADGKIVEVWYLADYLSVGMQMMAPLNEIEMRTLTANFYQFFNAHDLATASRFWTDDFVYDFVALPPPAQGKEAAAQFTADVFSGFPDFHVEPIRELVSLENHLIVRDEVATGTQLGEILGIPATGKQCTIRPLIIYEFSGNAIARKTEYLDLSSLLIQLGVMPPPAIPPLVSSFPLPDPVETDLSPLESAQELIGFWENKDIPRFMEKVHPEGQFMTVMGAPLDRAAVAGLLEHFISSSPDLHNEIVRIVELNDGWVVAEVVMTGTNTGSYFGLPPSGKPYELRYAALYHFDEDGLLTNFELYYDQVTLLTQLGFLQ